MRFYKKYWSSIRVFIKSYVYSFLLFYFAIDMWHLATGDMRPLRKKGILVEWLVLAEFTDSHTYTGFRITYTNHEPLLLRQSEQ